MKDASAIDPAKICNKCGSAFSTKYVLKRHVSFLNQIGTFLCDYKDFTFFNGNIFSVYVMISLGEDMWKGWESEKVQVRMRRVQFQVIFPQVMIFLFHDLLSTVPYSTIPKYCIRCYCSGSHGSTTCCNKVNEGPCTYIELDLRVCSNNYTVFC